jgi:HNH endonuclease
MTEDERKRFAAKWQLNTETGCWDWTACKDKHRYGRFYAGSRVQGAHRVAFAFVNGDIPAEMRIVHICNRLCCVNPSHLQAVTHAQSMRIIVSRDGIDHNANKTHCPKGHPYDPENTYLGPRGNGRTYRHCRICKRARRKQYHADNRDRLNMAAKERRAANREKMLAQARMENKRADK